MKIMIWLDFEAARASAKQHSIAATKPHPLSIN
jgi:hypothetical protein